ncbi:MAG TPA: alpha/beta hydrolase [Terriglobia bacterium]|nr:alpha/beta hydrolase [Terriglobia bacterium]
MTRQSFFSFRSERAKAEYEAFCLDRAKAWPIPSETMLLDTASGQTFVRASGRITDPPLVLLPGARSGSLMWIHNIAALSAHYRTYALDTMDDVGLSVKRRDMSKPEDYVNWLDEVFTVLVPEGQLSLMGISYGGWLAGQYALRFPGRVRDVVLLAPACTVLPTSFTFVVRILLLSIPIPGFGGRVRRTLGWLFRDAIQSGGAPQAEVEQVIVDLQLYDRLFALPRPPWPTVIDDKGWRGFSVPCLFLVGENEKIYSAKAAVRRLNRVAPQVKAEIIPGAGHDLTIVQADLVVRKVLGFLGGRAPAAAPAA